MVAPANAEPKVSVIIPAYNTAGLIVSCLDSVLAQTYRDFEILVVNDGSPDTPELETVLQPFLDKIVYIKQQNKGASGARNTAIGKARGEWLAFLDSDDLWLPHHLSEQMKLICADPSLDLVYANAMMMGAHATDFMQKCPSGGPANFEALIMERCQIPVSTVVARKSAIIGAGLFDESLARCDDYSMWVRTAFQGAKVAYTRTVQARLNEGRPGSLGASRFKMAEAYWIILEKLERTLPLSPSQRALVKERAAEIKARSQYELAKCELSDRHFANAVKLLSEANRHFHKGKIALAVMGLKIAPRVTSRLVAYWSQD